MILEINKTAPQAYLGNSPSKFKVDVLLTLNFEL
jgi:hypothetical protein